MFNFMWRCAVYAILTAVVATPAYADRSWHIDVAGKFTLLNSQGETVNEQMLLKKHTLIYFGYTNCLMACPPTWIAMDYVREELSEFGDKLNVFFVSIDPDRDTVDKIREWEKNWAYTKAFTGSREQIQNIGNVFHVFFTKKPMHAMPAAMKEMMRVRKNYGNDKRVAWDDKKPDSHYMMDHSHETFLLGPDGKFVTFFKQEEKFDTIVDVVRGHLQ